MSLASIAVADWVSDGTDADGVQWILTDLAGWDDVAATRSEFPVRAGSDGGVDPGPGLLAVRVLTWQGTAVAPDAVTLEGARAKLRLLATRLDGGEPFVLTEPSGASYLTRGRRSDGWHVSRVGEYAFEYQATLTCPDPLIYSATEHAASATLVDTSGGAAFNFPASFPMGFSGGGVGAGQMVATNSGTEDTWPVFRVDGPGDHLLLSDQASGSFLKISTLGSGEWVSLDPQNRAVLLMGYQSRRDLLESGSEWFSLPPGLDVITFSAAAFTAATVSMTWRDAY